MLVQRAEKKVHTAVPFFTESIFVDCVMAMGAVGGLVGVAGVMFWLSNRCQAMLADFEFVFVRPDDCPFFPCKSPKYGCIFIEKIEHHQRTPE